MRLSEKKHLELFAKSCRNTAIQMLAEAKSGHTGGSLSSIDILCFLYTQKLVKTNEKIVISNGHVSPALYAVLAEINLFSKEKVIKGFRKNKSKFEGHVNREIPGIWYSTGPLGTGVSAAAGMALAEKQNKNNKNVYALLGDGECQEGQVYEMMNFAAKYKLNNLKVFLDYNEVQLSGSLKKILPLNIPQIFLAGGWKVITFDGHNFTQIEKALEKANKEKNKPCLLVAKTIMGKGVSFLEKEGLKKKSTWHGKPPNEEEAKLALKELKLSEKELRALESYKKKFQKNKINTEIKIKKIKKAKKVIFKAGENIAPRDAYGMNLLEIAKKNPQVLTLTADLAESVKTNYVKKEVPKQHFDCGVAEQHLVSVSGGLSLSGIIPFCSTYCVFMTSRAKDQARVNDINKTNVKMVATHAGVSVGEDGPTHQAIEDIGSIAGFFHTKILEPADANHCAHMIHYITEKPGNFYVRMGRHKLPILTKKNGKPFFDKNYSISPGKCDILRKGESLTLLTFGSCAVEALEAQKNLKEKGISIEIILASSPNIFDSKLKKSLEKTKKLLTVEDHNPATGLASFAANYILEKNISLEKFEKLGISQYALSGTQKELYKQNKIDATSIEKKIIRLIQKV